MIGAALLTVFFLAPSAMAQKKGSNTFVSPTLGAKFVLIPAGSFMMGSPDSETGREGDETPQHPVTISRPFYMQTTEVTQGQWKRVMGKNPSLFSNCGNDCPVENVSWMNVQVFISKLNRMEGTGKYRLPTEAEWEYSARAGTTTRFCSGDSEDDLSRAGWYRGNSLLKTHPGGQKTPNPWGLYDMHGNVWEWVHDRNGNYPADSVTDPAGPSVGPHRLVRGGSWVSNDSGCRSANRLSSSPGEHDGSLGFRLLRRQ